MLASMGLKATVVLSSLVMATQDASQFEEGF
jgi:hypothetical protein